MKWRTRKNNGMNARQRAKIWALGWSTDCIHCCWKACKSAGSANQPQYKVKRYLPLSKEERTFLELRRQYGHPTFAPLSLRPIVLLKSLPNHKGSGKTLAYSLPILHKLLQESEKKSKWESSSSQEAGSGIQALVITPTRELAIQVADHMKKVSRHTHFRIATIIGGLAPQKQRRVLSRQPQILIATPGRLWELLNEVQKLFFPPLNDCQCITRLDHTWEIYQGCSSSL